VGQRIKNNIVYRGAVILFSVINITPRKCALFIGETLGLIAYLLIGKERHKALTNIDRAYGDDITCRRKREIIRRSFITFGRSTVEVMRMRRHFHGQMRPDVEVVGREKFEAAYNRGKGIIAFTGHIGNFELLAAWVAQHGYKSAVIGREMYDKRLDKMLIANRTDLGLVNVRTDDSPRKILRLLHDGYAIGFLIDTDSFRVAGELTPFYGRLAKTPTGPTELGLLSGAAFVPMFCLSFPGGKYKLIFGDELIPESRERSRENIYRITSQMTRVIENLIREYPEQWIWMHNRWHTRPDAADAEFLQSILR
jgi:KDO2-lipid IV(A) lauroyltransferase